MRIQRILAPPQFSHSFKYHHPWGLSEAGGPSLWGGVGSGQVAEVLQAFEVGVAGEVADAPVEVESELGGEGVGVGVEAVLVAALGEGDQ